MAMRRGKIFETMRSEEAGRVYGVSRPLSARAGGVVFACSEVVESRVCAAARAVW